MLSDCLDEIRHETAMLDQFIQEWEQTPLSADIPQEGEPKFVGVAMEVALTLRRCRTLLSFIWVWTRGTNTLRAKV